ncbi:hypothetical protein HAP48_0042900 [Bradyrhizobium septentrionale]|uniref:Uncharacterized protein n=1 Tax=Bradyrhizobium septentrionale TaxID=1404411 RepID=A0A973W2X0_9BRAD|nr:hypothetical protein [Bradyrhizobium septentrionale]UGY15207.1 hypothetical protein HAP48_0042900 [Bradyrhizobium septentrionale]
MGYTHYWTQKRNFTIAQWQQIIVDLKAILAHAQHVEGIVLAGSMGEGKTSPEFTDDLIAFNGLGDDSHESFYIQRKRTLEEWQSKDRLGWSFCKTAHKPYDRVVVACLCYLATVTRKEDPATHEPIIGSEAFSVTSDGDSTDFLAGLDMARVALPQYGNVLDLPLSLMEDDRWCAPWVSLCGDRPKYDVRFCVDGHGYVLKGKQSYRFDTHESMARWLNGCKRVEFKGGRHSDYTVRWNDRLQDNYRIEPNIWNATGSFDKARHARIQPAQEAALSALFPAPAANAHQPPAFVRPGQMPENGGREFCYSVTELLDRLSVKAA